MEVSDWIIASLILTTGASHVRAARFRRQRDEARGQATRFWNRWRETLGRAVAERNGLGATGGGGVKVDVIAEVSLDEALGIADGMESAATIPATPAPVATVEPGEPVILQFRRFWQPSSAKPYRGS